MKNNHNPLLLSVLAALGMLGNHTQAASATWSATAVDRAWSNT